MKYMGGGRSSAMVKRIVKITAIALAAILGLLLLIVVGYVIYVSAQYYRIEDRQNLKINAGENTVLTKTGEYTITTLNMGFGAYDKDFDFFMDSGTMKDGTKVTGTHSRGRDKDTVFANITGLIMEMMPIKADFMFFQEVDTRSTRAYGIDQYGMLQRAFGRYSSAFAQNFHSAYLMYPFNEPHGANESGIAVFSKYKMLSGMRRSFPVDNSFFNKFFDLDRCFIVMRLPLDNGKQLVLINLHMSAYDEGGIIRAQQLAMLNDILAEEKDNYVIAGGDFNHDIAGSKELFPTEQKTPMWIYDIEDEDIADGYKIAAAVNVGTCRAAEMPYTAGVNHTVVIDGFIVSDNIDIVRVENIDLGFEHSDHNPAKMTFHFG